MKFMALLTDGSTMIDTNLVTELLNLVKSVMSLFTEFPINIILIASLVFIAFGIFGRAKSAAM